jgi:ribosomal protein S27AE
MDVMIVNGKQVVKCQHCDGTTICKHSHWDSGSKPPRYRCGRCGDVLTLPGSLLEFRPKGDGRPPVCAGRGFIVV